MLAWARARPQALSLKEPAFLQGMGKYTPDPGPLHPTLRGRPFIKAATDGAANGAAG